MTALTREQAIALDYGYRLTFVLESPGCEPTQEESADPVNTMGSVFGESQWVDEKLLEVAAAEAGLTTIAVRVCQIVGGLNSYRRQKEWSPSLVRTSTFLHSFTIGIRASRIE